MSPKEDSVERSSKRAPRGILNGAAELESVGIVKGKKLCLVVNCWCRVRQTGKDKDVRGFMNGTWITLNQEFGPEV